MNIQLALNEIDTYYASVSSQPEQVRKRNIMKHGAIC